MKLIGERISESVARKLGHYVYLYVDPRTGRPFYVGRGVGARALRHLDSSHNGEVEARIRQLRRLRLQPQIDLLIHGLDEDGALRAESAAIDAFGLKNLANKARGRGGADFGRRPLWDVVAAYEAREIRIEEPCILIRINATYRPGMNPLELYEATRGIWKVKPENAAKARYALAVYQGNVMEVYELARDRAGSIWLPAGSAQYFTRHDLRSYRSSDRFEFVGRVAKESVRRRLMGRLPARFARQGSQNPIQYALEPGE